VLVMGTCTMNTGNGVVWRQPDNRRGQAARRCYSGGSGVDPNRARGRHCRRKRVVKRTRLRLVVPLIGALAGIMVVPTVASATTPREQAIVDVAAAQLGKPYVWGDAGPFGFDCSGLVDYVYLHGVGIPLPRTAAGIYASLPHESAAQVQPGDVVAFLSGGVAYHVGIVYSVANHWMIVAPGPGAPVQVQSWNWGGDTVRFAYAPIVHAPPPPPPAYLAPIRAATPQAAYGQAVADYRAAAAARASGVVMQYLMDQVLATQAVVLHTVGTAAAHAAYAQALAAYRAAVGHASGIVMVALYQRVIFAQSTYTGRVVAVL
jgi:hypothetical protein